VAGFNGRRRIGVLFGVGAAILHIFHGLIANDGGVAYPSRRLKFQKSEVEAMRRVALSLLVVGFLATPAAAGWKNLTGQPVPPISAKEWLNTDRYTPSVADLRGKVYLIEFFATW
jgi:hypothetical protein